MVASSLLSLAVLAASAVGQQSASYAPSLESCTVNNTVQGLREAGTLANQTLASGEQAYVTTRKADAAASFQTFLGSLAQTVYNGTLAANNTPTIALAVSGGGDRAALYGAGVFAALDARNSSAVSAGTGGLFQSATYMSALSGGSWFLSSFIFNDFPPLYDMVLGNEATGAQGWYLIYDLFSPNSTNTTANTAYPSLILADVAEKQAAGFNVTFGDYWARTLSHHFLPGTTEANFFNRDAPNHGASLSYSSAVNLPSWQNHSIPFPIIVADALSVNDTNKPFGSFAAVPLQNTVYEMTPLEFGSYDPQLATFVPMEILGTRFDNGTPLGGPTTASNTSTPCVTGFDNAGFILGISSNLFYAYNITQNVAWDSPLSPIYVAWNAINTSYYAEQPTQQLDISAVPNPFKGRGNGYEDINQDQLRLIDGGLDGEVDPIAPLAVPARHIDVIVLADANLDTTNGPDGSALVATEARASILPAGTQQIPPLPKTNITWVAQGLNVRPTFFGCQGTAPTLGGQANSTQTYPMLVYLPNYNRGEGVTNTSTSQLVYSNAEASRFLDVSFNYTILGMNVNGSQGADPEWPTCLRCATIERSRGRAGVDQTTACTNCFTRYCWNGTESTSVPAGTQGGGNGTDSTTGGTGVTTTNVTGTSTGSGTSTGTTASASGTSGSTASSTPKSGSERNSFVTGGGTLLSLLACLAFGVVLL